MLRRFRPVIGEMLVVWKRKRNETTRQNLPWIYKITHFSHAVKVFSSYSWWIFSLPLYLNIWTRLLVQHYLYICLRDKDFASCQLRAFRSHPYTLEGCLSVVHTLESLLTVMKLIMRSIQETVVEGREVIATEIFNFQMPCQQPTKEIIVRLTTS